MLHLGAAIADMHGPREAFEPPVYSVDTIVANLLLVQKTRVELQTAPQPAVIPIRTDAVEK